MNTWAAWDERRYNRNASMHHMSSVLRMTAFACGIYDKHEKHFTWILQLRRMFPSQRYLYIISQQHSCSLFVVCHEKKKWMTCCRTARTTATCFNHCQCFLDDWRCFTRRHMQCIALEPIFSFNAHCAHTWRVALWQTHTHTHTNTLVIKIDRKTDIYTSSA